MHLIKNQEISLPMYVVDAFTTGNNNPWSGNPAGVIILEYDDDVSREDQQRIATSLRLSQTAVVSRGWNRPSCPSEAYDGLLLRGNKFHGTIRWYSPTDEFQLCGHATIGAVKGILTHLEPNLEIPLTNFEFQTQKSGILRATVQNVEDDPNPLITIDFPENVTQSVGMDSSWVPGFARTVLGSSFPDGEAHLHDIRVAPKLKFPTYAIVILKQVPGEDPEKTLRRVSPDMAELAKYTHDPGTIIATIQAADSAPEDFYGRTFAPFYGVPEDPCCGSAHTLLTPFWTNQLGKEGQLLKTRHLSPRGGKLQVLWKGDRVLITGNSRVVVKGHFNV